MNNTARNIDFSEAALSPAAAAPQAIFSQTMFALTRPGTDGQLQFASRIGWTTDMAEAAMACTSDQIGLSLPREMREAERAKPTRVTMTVYDAQASDGVVASPWDRHESVIVARRIDGSDRENTKVPPRFVTCASWHMPHVIGDRVWQAVTIGDAGQATAAALRGSSHGAVRPGQLIPSQYDVRATHDGGQTWRMEKRDHRHAFTPATRVTTFEVA
jgi:hypothetical protein